MATRLVPLGGLGEFGANSLLVEGEGDEALLVDAGAAFSDLEPYGVAYELPDFGALAVPPQAVLLTHGHDDHARGVADVVAAFPNLAVAGSRATLARLRRDEGMAGEWRGVELAAERRATLAGFEVEVLPVSHSIPGTLLVRLRSDSGTLVLASDFRLAPSALAETTSLEQLAAWGEAGVDLLLLDATNALVRGPLVAEATVAAAIEEQVAAARGAVVGVTFASHLGRFRQLARAAVASGRRVVPVGRGLDESLAVQAELGGLDLPPGSVRSLRSIARLPREGLLLVATGSQGEPGSGLARIAGDAVAGFRLAPGDLVLHCARIIPGNERRLADLFDHCVRRGARVVTADEVPIHVSGHPPQDELRQVVRLLRPRTVVPVHGRRRHLEAVGALCRDEGCAWVVVENGAELAWHGASVQSTGVYRGVGRLLVGEAAGTVLDPVTLRQRRHLGANGLVVATLSRRQGGQDPCAPQLHFVGLDVSAETRRGLLADLAREARHLLAAPVGDGEALRSTMSRWLRREVRRRTGRRPSTVVVVAEC